MNILCKRLDRLERNRPAGAYEPIDMAGLDPDVVTRVTAAMADRGFPQSLSDADLQTLVDLANEQGAT